MFYHSEVIPQYQIAMFVCAAPCRHPQRQKVQGNRHLRGTNDVAAVPHVGIYEQHVCGIPCDIANAC